MIINIMNEIKHYTDQLNELNHDKRTQEKLYFEFPFKEFEISA